MSDFKKAVLLQLAFFVGLPFLAACLIGTMQLFGFFLLVFLFFFWCWELFAFSHYRFCRQEEFLHLLQTAAATKAPVESMLRAYLDDRPREQIYRFALLFFVFPGYYWIHMQRSFDVRLRRLAAMLESGIPLSQAIRMVPGVASREMALAVTVGQFTGQLAQSLKRLHERRLTPLWAEFGPRLFYPLLLLVVLTGVLGFLMVFIIPKFEKIFLEFRLRLPYETELLIVISRWFVKHSWVVPFLIIDLVVLFNLMLFSAQARWYTPVLGSLYRMQTRGQFLQTLGLMLETGRPLPAILDAVLESELLPRPVHWRVDRLAEDLRQGQPLAESLARHGLVTEPMRGLIASAEKAQNLTWALQELGDSMIRRSSRLAQRIALIVFPLAIFFCACLIGFVAISIFSPLVALIDHIHG
jgi:type II secretory pathway component PulF